jgi:short-subunit dehydrogenase
MRDKDPGRKTALVTGASSGIGREVAALLAKDGHNLVLVARREDRLRELQEEWSNRYSVTVRVVAMDLTEPTAPQELFDELSGTAIDILINNAGFGTYGPFAESDTSTQMEMIQLNIATLTHLTRLFLPPMIGRGEGRVMNVASTAAFLPGPLMAVYYATKSYVLSFSEALVEELQGSGVTVTALCPGPVATEFQARANLERSGLLRFALVDARPVAEVGYRAMMAGKAIVVPGVQNKLIAQLAGLAPRSLVRKVVKKVQSQVKQ